MRISFVCILRSKGRQTCQVSTWKVYKRVSYSVFLDVCLCSFLTPRCFINMRTCRRSCCSLFLLVPPFTKSIRTNSRMALVAFVNPIMDDEIINDAMKSSMVLSSNYLHLGWRSITSDSAGEYFIYRQRRHRRCQIICDDLVTEGKSLPECGLIFYLPFVLSMVHGPWCAFLLSAVGFSLLTAIMIARQQRNPRQKAG